MVKIDFIDSAQRKFSDELKEQISKALEICLDLNQVDHITEVSVEFLEPDKVQELNSDYRGIDKTTDVLSFPIYSGLEEIKEQDFSLPVLLGDIIINPVRAAEQAESIGNTFEREVTFLSVHSLLHLLGYDHIEDEEKKKMRDQEKEIMFLLDKKDE